MLTEADYKVQGQKKAEELSEKEKLNNAPFFASGDETVEGELQPVIPGSSLRGMLRSLVEIIAHGHMHWVAKEPTFTFRAVAASRDDPLRQPYNEVIGPFSRNVRAGYLQKDGDDWYIKPALTPADVKGWPNTRENWLKIKEHTIGSDDIPNFMRFNDDGYHPQWHIVTFGAEIRRGQRGSHIAISQIGSKQAGYEHSGVLVCAGNMLETAAEQRSQRRERNQRSPRKNHALIMAPNPSAKRLKIKPQAIRDYINGLTPFQKDDLTAWGTGKGCLPTESELDQQRKGKMITFASRQPMDILGPPVFYAPNEDDTVSYFGHSPNFRIPARLYSTNRAATPYDFVPEHLRSSEKPDLAEAIFGWVEDKEDRPALERQRAGRVFVGDARLVPGQSDVWYSEKPIAPHILASPKPTTFQHYLVQNRANGHDPDDKESLAHYGTPPNETEIRGHKLYWHKGANPDIKATPKEHEKEKQLTRIKPVKAGIKFKFRIYFENLCDEELGALLWALALPVHDDNDYCHKIGMGKPLGMGSVSITPTLTLIDRLSRYESLFTEDDWHTATRPSVIQPYLDAFEQYMQQEMGISKPFTEIERMQMLLTLLQWREGDANWQEATRYMEIEHGPHDDINEYSARPVLPDPLEVMHRASESSRPTRPQRTTSNSTSASDYHTGRVKMFRKTFGFIQPDGGGKDVFVHRNQLRKPLQTLSEDQRVRFRVGQGMKGPEAVDVHLLD
jgi:CRISPR-associated protein (TIGR03986 family)